MNEYHTEFVEYTSVMADTTVKVLITQSRVHCTQLLKDNQNNNTVEFKV